MWEATKYTNIANKIAIIVARVLLGINEYMP